MRERKYVKFRVDMYADTKFKIIDMKPERDLIHYIWNRVVILAGKVNLEGDLYMSKNIPYTIETLAIEFNRGTYQVKVALDVLMKLEMIELTENNVYRVKNFAKHQNIKVKEEKKSNDKEENIENNDEVEVKENSINEAAVNLGEIPVEVACNEDEVAERKISGNKEENVKENGILNLEIITNDINKFDDDKIDNSQNNIPIILETKKNKKSNKRKKKEVNIETIDEDIEVDISDCFHDAAEDVEEDRICYFYDGNEGRLLSKEENVVKEWSF